MSTLLRLDGLDAGYGDLTAVSGVSLEVRHGEAVALIGSNGAGKTTTLRAITGLLPCRGGRVEFAGARIDGLGSAQIVARGIAHVPEGRQLFPTLTVRDNLELGSRGGEQQMCAIGRGLMARPRLLLLDEPSLGLAPVAVKLIFETLRRVNDAGTTLLLVEQNVPRALQLSHRGYVLENGRIALAGTRADLLANPHVKQAYLGL